MRVWITRAGFAAIFMGVLAWASSFVVPMNVGPGWYAQIVGLLAAGIITIVGAQFRSVKKKVGLDVAPEIEPSQQKDLEAFNHLTERMIAAKDEDGVGACRILQERLFVLHYGDFAESKTGITNQNSNDGNKEKGGA